MPVNSPIYQSRDCLPSLTALLLPFSRMSIELARHDRDIFLVLRPGTRSVRPPDPLNTPPLSLSIDTLWADGIRSKRRPAILLSRLNWSMRTPKNE